MEKEIDYTIRHYLLVEDLEPIVYLIAIIVIAILAYSIYKNYKIWFRGSETLPFRPFLPRFKRLIIYGILQYRVIKDRVSGLTHGLIYSGMIILLIGTAIRALEYDLSLKLFGFRVLTGLGYLTFKLLMNIAGILVIVGVTIAICRRVVGIPPKRPTYLQDYLILLGVLSIVITGFILDAGATSFYRKGWIGWWDPLGRLISSWVDITPSIYRAIWLLHLTLALGIVALMPFSKLSHLYISGLFNTYFSRLEGPSTFKPVPNIDELIEQGKGFGATRVSEFSWKQRMDFDACTLCARCENACPASTTDKPLSPMKLMLTMKNLMHGKDDREVIPEILTPEFVWSCVSCGACVYECPVLIHHVETVIDIRRNLAPLGKDTPDKLQAAAYNTMRTGNPYGANPADSVKWRRSLSEKLGIKTAKPGEEYGYIYWIGCAPSYNPEIRPSVEAVIKALKKAEINFAILEDEKCCGEPARRIGDELLFKEMALANIEQLKRYKFKKLIISCPHGLNVFKHEYNSYGEGFEVIHHVQLLSSLVREGRLKVKEVNGKFTYHDPCYLARWNGIINEPRDILRRAGEFVEMEKHGANAFCCGGGGGHVFFDIKIGERIGTARAKQVKETGADRLIVACPNCNLMMRSEGVLLKFKVYDISEVIDV